MARWACGAGRRGDRRRPGVPSSTQPASWRRRTERPPRYAAPRARDGQRDVGRRRRWASPRHRRARARCSTARRRSPAGRRPRPPPGRPCSDRRAPRAAGTSRSRAQMQSNRSSRATARPSASISWQRVVDAPVAGRDGGDPVDLAEVAPELALGLRGGADEERDLGLAGRPVPLPVVVDLVGDRALDLAGRRRATARRGAGRGRGADRATPRTPAMRIPHLRRPA